jgi:hypothetical protein
VEIAQGTLEVGYGQSLRQQERPQTPRVLLHQRSLTVAYVRLSEAQFVNVGTVMTLPSHRKVAADLASGEQASQGRGSVVVAGVTSGQGGGNAVHRAKGARSTATPME